MTDNAAAIIAERFIEKIHATKTIKRNKYFSLPFLNVKRVGNRTKIKNTALICVKFPVFVKAARKVAVCVRR